MYPKLNFLQLPSAIKTATGLYTCIFVSWQMCQIKGFMFRHEETRLLDKITHEILRIKLSNLCILWNICCYSRLTETTKHGLYEFIDSVFFKIRYPAGYSGWGIIGREESLFLIVSIHLHCRNCSQIWRSWEFNRFYDVSISSEGRLDLQVKSCPCQGQHQK